ncbi:MAG: 16S rRNA (uracil(1498)-N(3))-methyltransferase [Planctomycetes bacterium]|nr:16S rRNA (uracil(1498)-N(3))-methyltransferase [Planctomycetota bacterium]
MNLLLLEPGEVDETGRATIRGRRARHVRQVLRAAPGQQLRAGLLDGPIGLAEIEAIADDELTVKAKFDQVAPAAVDAVLMAVPRPKVLLRMLGHAAALGFGRIILLRTWRVDKSHLASTAMDPTTQREHLVLGLEQAGRTMLPRVDFFPLFRPFVEDRLPMLGLPPARFVADPRAPTGTEAIALGRAAAFALALGPDGGLLPYEVEQLASCGFLPVHCGRQPLRTETALAVMTGQLDLVRRQATVQA